MNETYNRYGYYCLWLLFALVVGAIVWFVLGWPAGLILSCAIMVFSWINNTLQGPFVEGNGLAMNLEDSYNEAMRKTLMGQNSERPE